MEKRLEMTPQQIRASQLLYTRFLKAQKIKNVRKELKFNTFLERDLLSDHPRRYIMYCREDDGSFIATIEPVVFDVPNTVELEEIHQTYDGSLYLGQFIPVDPWVSEQVHRQGRLYLLGHVSASQLSSIN